jgi:hypothetical protein
MTLNEIDLIQNNSHSVCVSRKWYKSYSLMCDNAWVRCYFRSMLRTRAVIDD